MEASRGLVKLSKLALLQVRAWVDNYRRKRAHPEQIPEIIREPLRRERKQPKRP